MNYENLKALVNAKVYENTEQEITGEGLNEVLQSIVTSLGVGYQFVGIATPSTNPGTPDQNVMYFAATAGTYPNFGGIVVGENELAILKYNGTWDKLALPILSASLLGLTAFIYSPYLSAKDKLGSAYVGAYPPITMQAAIRGKRIIAITINIASTGTLSVVKATNVGTENFQYSIIKTFTVSNTGIQILNFDVPVILDNDEWLGIGITSDTAKWYVSVTHKDDGIPFWAQLSNQHWLQYDGDLQIAVLSMPELPTITKPHSNIKLIASDALTKGTVNSVPENYGVGAFIDEIWQRLLRNQRITAIYLNIGAVGTLSVVKGTNVTIASPKTFEHTLIKTFTVTSLGITRLEFDTPVILGENEWLGIGVSGDTGKWKIEYPVVSANPMLFWQANRALTSWSLTEGNLCAGFEIDFWFDYARRKVAGKKITIIGDSISAYKGTLPTSEFVPKYPANDITSVTQMWWKQVIDALGLILDKNNSWDGSPVSSDESVEHRSATSSYRLGYIGNPDIVVIFMGTNDWGHRNKTLGDFAPVEGAALNKNVFYQAYQYLIESIQTTNPKARIICCTPLQRGDTAYTPNYFTSRNGHYLYEFRDAIKKIAKIYGCDICDLSSCGITYFNSKQSLTSPLYMFDGLHPNRKGMNLIADKIIETIINI